MGAVLVSKRIHEAFMQGPPGAIELFHGYTYSAHPAACAAGLATLSIYQRENLLTRAKQVAPAFERAVHGLRGLPHVIDIRNYGLVAGIELEPLAGSPGKRAFDVYLKCFERGLLVRTTGDIIALSPALIIEQTHIDELIGILSESLED
jgi:beta-alanine--pyruvate transaminase